jgi:glycosyltransferase involved in cell wall biosynthesis
MNVWLISPYGPIPDEGWREYRYSIIADVLAQAGYDVTWWTPNFSHHFKRYRSAGWEDRLVRPGFRLRLVPTSGYSRNVSLARLRYETLFAWRTYRRALSEPSPGCIIAAEPPQVTGRVGVWLSRRHTCPLIVDVMDLWPELFTLGIPARLRRLAPVLFSPLTALRRRNYGHSHALMSLCNTYRDIALREVPDVGERPSVTIFNGVDVAAFRAAMRRRLTCKNLPPKAGELWAVYAGTLGENYDVPALLQAAQVLQNRGTALRIIVAGEGPLAAALQAFVRERQISNLTYIGSLPPSELAPLYSRCDVGICAYGAASNVAMPDKAYDYMAAGLPIVSSLRGELADLLERRGCGLSYRAGDADSLASALQLLSSDEALRARMARLSSEAGMEFDRTVQYRQLPTLIEQLTHC